MCATPLAIGRQSGQCPSRAGGSDFRFMGRSVEISLFLRTKDISESSRHVGRLEVGTIHGFACASSDQMDQIGYTVPRRLVVSRIVVLVQ